MTKLLQRRSLKFNMSRSIWLTALIGTFLVAIIAYTLVTEHQWNKLTSEADAALEKTRVFANGEIMAYLNSSIALSSNADLINLLNYVYPESMETRIRTVNEINKFFAVTNATQSADTTSFVIYTDNKTLYKNKYILDVNKMINKSIVDDLKQLSFSDVLWKDESKTHFVFYRCIDTSLNLNILRVQIPRERIDSYIQSTSTTQYTISYGKAEQDLNGHTTSISLLNGEYLSVHIPSNAKYELYLVNLAVTCCGLLILSIILFSITNALAERMTKNINKFIEYIAKDDTLMNPSSVTVEDYKEFTFIKQRIVQLLQDQQILHDKLRESATHIQKIELELLQCRFNPHLLYNTLSVFKWNILRGSTKNSTEVLDVLSDYYRKILNQEETEIPLEQETALLKQYVKIMEFAQSEKYTFEIDLEPSLSKFLVIKHSLQPLLENSILHGVSQRPERIIRLTARRVNDTVQITVHDNGRGISQERLAEIQSENYTSVYKSYGLKNTINSFKTQFGENRFQFSIESYPDIGTTVMMTVYTDENKDKNIY